LFDSAVFINVAVCFRTKSKSKNRVVVQSAVTHILGLSPTAIFDQKNHRKFFESNALPRFQKFLGSGLSENRSKILIAST
jgi:hypothetical protein